MNPDLSKLPLCDQNWDAMEEVGDGRRFCSRCRHPVTDFRGMTKDEITLLHVMSDERVCGVYSPEHLKPVLSEPSRGRHGLVTLALGASLLAARADAQVAERPAAGQAQLPAPAQPPRSAPDEAAAPHPQSAQDDTLVIHGTIRTTRGEAVVSAVVMVAGTNLRTITDSAGGYVLRVPGSARQGLRLRMGRIGMATKEVAISARGNETQVDVHTRMETVVLGGITMAAQTRDDSAIRPREVGYSVSRIMGSP